MDFDQQARDWRACAAAYWAAARRLPADDAELELPRLRLAAFAVEYQLRAFVCAVRGGIPEGGDLGRLAGLAALCGLRLDATEQAAVDALSFLHRGATDTAGAPSLAAVARLLERVSAQAEVAGG